MYITDRFLPDKAIDIIDEAGSKIRLRVCWKSEETSKLEVKINHLLEEKDYFIKMA